MNRGPSNRATAPARPVSSALPDTMRLPESNTELSSHEEASLTVLVDKITHNLSLHAENSSEEPQWYATKMPEPVGWLMVNVRFRGVLPPQTELHEYELGFRWSEGRWELRAASAWPVDRGSQRVTDTPVDQRAVRTLLGQSD